MSRVRLTAVICVLIVMSAHCEDVRGAEANSGSLADALIAVDRDENTWGHRCLFAFGLEIGIPERTLMEAWPGARLESLPPKVLETLRQGPAGISAWMSCLKDQRPTGIAENDLITGGSSTAAKKLTCRDAALLALRSVVPLKSLPAALDKEAIVARVSKIAPDWEKECRSLSPAERMRKWFDGSDDNMRRMFLALAIQMRYAPAYPLLEAGFLSRAKQPEPFLMLEVSAYVRHRRKAAAAFESQVAAAIRQKPLNNDMQFLLKQWQMLVKNADLEGDIQDWLAGKIDLRTLGELVERSVDQPWANHSVPIEAVAVGRPIAEANLRSLLAAADRERPLEKRFPLLLLAQEETHILKHVITRTDSLARRPLSRSDAAEWKDMIVHLRALVDDRRITLGRRSATTPGETAAQVVWLLWGPNTDHMATLFHGAPPDWRGDEIDPAFGSTRSLLVEAAQEFLAHPAGIRPQALPTAEAARLAKQFDSGKAVDWRKRLDALRWDQRLLVQVEAKHDNEFAVRLWPRLVEFVDYQIAAPAKSASFDALWRDKLADHNLDATTWAVLGDWVVAEARADRWWMLIGESSPCRPGVSLYAFQARRKRPANSPFPTFEAEIDGRISFFTRPDRGRITPTGLEPLPAKKDDFVDYSKYPTPVEALALQSKRTAKDHELNTRGFTFHMMALPGK
jgi:hypothetical protein